MDILDIYFKLSFVVMFIMALIIAVVTVKTFYTDDPDL